ncbi:MAG: aldehyde ferredoxin oxidoreductase C-terminal domain-containing protein [Nitrososphaerota archaeon]|nr:aldehyde ferredoxin oxidoreductase [Candidatus Bathyarchaeota archaeon]MDW8023064.1 aldehyde ferredoxin oxidoreductase C-terminal domain-containing protein [Nitrososphaerota archaeon]
MIYGYAGKFLEVDLSTKSFKEVKFSDEVLRDYVGGRGLAAKILWDRLGGKWETVDPLGLDNLLLLLTGPLTGFFPGGRICVSGKSPQSNGVVGSTVAGEFGVELKCAGYDGIIVAGEAEKPVYLFIKDGDVEVRDASHIWGMDAKQTVSTLTRECRELLRTRYPQKGEWKEPSIVYIGPAGENKVRTAVVAAKWTHAAGYGGYGAVMGSKKLKAVAVKGTGPLPEVANLEKVEMLMQRVCEGAYENDSWRRWGTGSGGYEFGAKTSSEPVRNWQGEWHDEKSFGVDQFENRVWVKNYWGDFGCPTTCLKIAVVKHGKFKGAITDNPDYELQAYLGPNLGIFTPEDNVYVASVIDDLGLCGIQTGNVLGFAAELFQRGILTTEDLDGVELKWGDAGAFAVMAKKIAYREGIGNVLAEGTYRAAVRIGKIKGVDVVPYAVHVKGIGVGAHGIRSGRDFAEAYSYACSVQCGDHTSLACKPLEDPRSEAMTIFGDSAVYCVFNAFGLPHDVLFEFYEAVTGLKLTKDMWIKNNALKTLQLQRAMLLLGGPDIKWDPKVHDDNPPRFYEPLPAGPFKGKAADRERVNDEKRKYYEVVGWDERGIPKSDVLLRLGLEDVDKALEKLR